MYMVHIYSIISFELYYEIVLPLLSAILCYLAHTINNAYMTPGMKPNIVNTISIQNGVLQPSSKNTANGGNINAIITRIIRLKQFDILGMLTES